jgi:hypothetical protein
MKQTVTKLNFEEYAKKKGEVNLVFKNHLTLILENLKGKHLPSLTHEESDLGQIVIGCNRKDIDEYIRKNCNFLAENENYKANFMTIFIHEILDFYLNNNGYDDFELETIYDQIGLMEKYLVISIYEFPDELLGKMNERDGGIN